MRRLLLTALTLLVLNSEAHAKPTCFAGQPWRAWADADPQRLYINGDEESMLLEYIGPIAEDENGRPVPPETVSFFKRIAVPPGRYRLLGNVSAGNSNDGWQLLVETGQAGRSPLVLGTVPPHSDRKLNDIVVIRTGMVPSVKLRAVTHNKSWAIVSRVRLCRN